MDVIYKYEVIAITYDNLVELDNHKEFLLKNNWYVIREHLETKSLKPFCQYQRDLIKKID